MIWWQLEYDDPFTRQHFIFEWKTSPNDRKEDGSDNPYISGQKVWMGFNDLKTRYPNVAAQWNYKKNGDLKPENVVFGSPKKVWWIMPYDDPATGNHFDFEWKGAVNNRLPDGSDCPFISNYAVWEGFNDLASTYPSVSAEWHPIKNRKRTPNKVFMGESRKAWWKCSVCGHEWYTSVKSRTYDDAGCPECRRKIRYYKEKGWRYANPFNQYGYHFIPLNPVLKQCIQSVITTLCFHRQIQNRLF